MKINLSAVVDNAKFGPFQGCVLALCFLLIMVDGYDLVTMGVTLPTIISETKMDPAVAGLITSCALFGMMFGAIFLGAFADRIGRVKTIVLCVFVFSTFTALTGFAKGPNTFAMLRFIAGLGLGGVIPCITSAITEYSPKRLRSRMMTLMLAGYPLGGVLVALLGKHFLEAFGWQFVFFVAVAPIVLIPVILKSMPESAAILQKRGDANGLREVARRIDPSLSISDLNEVHVPAQSHHAKAPVVRLFQEGRGLSTVMLWIGYFSGLFMLYALNSWLTKLMAMAGYSLGSALTFLMLMNCGSIAGSLLGGWLSDRIGLKRVMPVMLVCGSVATVMLAQQLPLDWLFVVIFIVGATASGAQGLANAYAAQFYPVEIRSTGMGMALGMGRIGGIAAPIIIGLLISFHLPFEQNFYAIAFFGVLQAIATLLINDRVADFNAAPPAQDAPFGIEGAKKV